MSRRLRSFTRRRTHGLLAAVASLSLIAATAPPAWADAAADAVINRGIGAIGGEVRLAKATAVTTKIRGAFVLGDNAFDFRIEQTTDGLNRVRSTFEGDFSNNKATTVTVIDGDKGWIKEGEMEARELEKEEIVDDKWGRFSQSMDLLLVALREKNLKFTTEIAGDQKVGHKLAAGVSVTGPGDKHFTVYFDKQSGLPVKVVADLPDPESPGQEFTQETYFSSYRDFSGIKRATKVEMKRDGHTFIKIELLDVKVLDKVDRKTFAKPE